MVGRQTARIPCDWLARSESPPPDGATKTLLGPSLVASLAASHQDGTSCAALASERDLGKMTVVRQLRNAGVPTKCVLLTTSEELVH